MPVLQIDRLTIVGTGLLGGSVGLGLRAAGLAGRIVGVGRRQVTLDRAIDRGCIDEGVTDLAEGAAGSDLIVLATPIATLRDGLRHLGRLDCGAAVITDVGSTKQSIVNEAAESLPKPERFVGSHPMAGSEEHGPAAARADLFQGRPVVITPTDGTDADALALVEDLWRTLGMRIVRMNATEHDRLAACISHLPHALAVLLVDVAAAQGGLDIAASGFADTTRVASGDPAVWTDIFCDNADHVINAIDQWQEHLTRFRTLLADGDRQRIHDLLTTAKQTRDDWLPTQPED